MYLAMTLGSQVALTADIQENLPFVDQVLFWDFVTCIL